MSSQVQLGINIVIAIILVIWCFYTVFNFFRKRKKVKAIPNVVHQNELSDIQEFVADVPEVLPSTTIYEEQGDREFSYEIGIQLEGKEKYVKTYYGFSSDVTREDILNQFFYVNDREIMLVEDDGEHYYNQNRIVEITFNNRKILNPLKEVNSVNESEDISEEELALLNDSKINSNDEVVSDSIENALESSYETSNIEENQHLSFTDDKKKKFFKKKKNKLPSLKKYRAKTFNIWFFSFLIIFLLIAPFSLARTFGISTRVDKLDNRINNVKDSKSDGSESSLKTADVYRLNHFMESFLSTYLTTSDNSEEKENRNKVLQGYFATNVSLEGSKDEGVKNFVSAELIDFKEGKQTSLAKYQVTYELKNDTEAKEQTEVLLIPFVSKGKGFSIVGLPAVTSKDKLTSYFDGINNNEKGDSLTGSEQEKVKKFVELFLQKYASGTKEELSLYMEKVESMGKGYELEEINQIESFSYKGKIHVYVQGNFKQVTSGNYHKESFSFEMEKSNGQYKIVRLNHYLGGLTDGK